ncbi:MAG: M6 family metalloprotease domain-containing protein [Candidatus Zixiibacteriota bacterium]
MTSSIFSRGISITVVISCILTVSVFAIPPSPDACKRWRMEGTYEHHITGWRNFEKQYHRTYRDFLEVQWESYKISFPTGQAVLPDTLRLPVILVEFPGYPAEGQAAAGTPVQFDSILFSTGYHNPTGSMTEFYLENSYGAFYVTGDVFGWYIMPHPYDWYVADDYGLSRSQSLATDAVAAADGEIDFGDYDADNDGYCDGVIIIHAGPGAEECGDGHIWSHRGWLVNAVLLDNVRIRDYLVDPEEFDLVLSPIGVVGHNFGHLLNLPDLYDINYTDNKSCGLGRWSLMAEGAYNNHGRTPAELDAWCKIFLGFIQPVTVDANLKQTAIPRVETSPTAYVLANTSVSATEYWIVENRQPTGSDTSLPGNGLLIYHVDEAASFDNSDPYRYHVALEQADGLNALAFGGSSGDSSDPFPGMAGNHNFHDLTRPNTRTNILETTTEIGVWHISESQDTMYADLDISYSRPFVMLKGNDSIRFDDSFGGNGNSVVEQGETVGLYLWLVNYMLSAGYAEITLSASNPRLQIIQGAVTLDNPLVNSVPVSNAGKPFIFTVPADFETADVIFYLTLSIDSTLGEGAGAYADTLEFVETIGTADFIVVSSGNSAVLNTESVYKENLRVIGEQVRFWDRSRSFPDPEFLGNFKAVFWVTDTSTVSVFTPDDILVMKNYLDRGGRLCVVSPCGVEILVGLDSAFVADYFRFTLEPLETEAFTIYGVAENSVGEGVQLCLDTGLAFNGRHKILQPVSDGEKAFELVPEGSGGTVGVSYEGFWRSLFLTFPIETVLDDQTPAFNTKAELLERIVQFMNGDEITGVEDDNAPATGPKNFVLYQNYPNPFNPGTVIKYTLSPQSGNIAPERTRLEVYNLLGQKIKTLVDAFQSPGSYEIIWDGTGDAGERVATGFYFYRLQRGKTIESKKMLLLK